MSTLTICDLAHSSELDQAAMCAVRGGNSAALSGPFANVDVDVNVNTNTNIFQVQSTEVNVLNNSFIGASFPVHLAIAPKQLAFANVAPKVAL